MSALGAALGAATAAYRVLRLPPSLVNSAAARPISTWHSTGGTAVHAASTWERPKSAAPTVRVTNLVSSSSAAVSCLPLTSDVVAPVQAALTRRSIRILGSSRYG